VSPVNDAPLFTSDPITTIQVDSNYSYSVTASDTEGNASLALAIVALPDWLTLTNLSPGKATLHGTSPSESGSHDVTLSVTDGVDADLQSFVIEVTEHATPVGDGFSELALASDLSATSNWFHSSWFGHFYDPGRGTGWIFHMDQGWVHPVITASGGVWLYDYGMRAWMWTHPSVYSSGQAHPFYSNDDQDWTYHDSKSSNPRMFYHYAYEEWRPEGTVRVTVETSEGGEVSGDGLQPKGENVTLVATADSGYVFESWGGDASGTDDTVTILADGEKNVTATFRQMTVDEVMDILFLTEGLSPDDLPDVDVKAVMDALFE